MSKLVFILILCLVIEKCYSQYKPYRRIKRGKYYSNPPQRFYSRPPFTFPTGGIISYTPPPNFKDDEPPYPGGTPKVSKPPTNEGLGDEDINKLVKYLTKQDFNKILEYAKIKERENDADSNGFKPSKYNDFRPSQNDFREPSNPYEKYNFKDNYKQELELHDAVFNKYSSEYSKVLNQNDDDQFRPMFPNSEYKTQISNYDQKPNYNPPVTESTPASFYQATTPSYPEYSNPGHNSVNYLNNNYNNYQSVNNKDNNDNNYQNVNNNYNNHQGISNVDNSYNNYKSANNINNNYNRQQVVNNLDNNYNKYQQKYSQSYIDTNNNPTLNQDSTTGNHEYVANNYGYTQTTRTQDIENTVFPPYPQLSNNEKYKPVTEPQYLTGYNNQNDYSNTKRGENIPRLTNLRDETDYELSYTNKVPSVANVDSTYKVENFGNLPLMEYNSKLASSDSYNVPHYSVTSPSTYSAQPPSPSSSSSPPTYVTSPLLYGQSSWSQKKSPSSYGKSPPIEPAPPISTAWQQSDAHLKATRIWTSKSRGTAYTLHDDGTLSLEKPLSINF